MSGSPSTRRKILAGLAAIVAGALAAYLVPKPPPELSRAELLNEAREGRVSKVVLTDYDVITGESKTRGPFRTTYKTGDTALIAELQEMGVEISYEETGDLIP